MKLRSTDGDRVHGRQIDGIAYNIGSVPVEVPDDRAAIILASAAGLVEVVPEKATLKVAGRDQISRDKAPVESGAAVEKKGKKSKK